MDRSSFDRRQRHILFLLFGVGAALFLSLLANVLLLAMREDLVVLLPSEISGEYTISRSRLDERYLADASTTLSYLYFSTTPATVDFRKKEIMRWVHPASTQSIERGLDEEAERIKSQRLTTSFSIREVEVDVSGGASAEVRVVGDLSRFVGDRQFDQSLVRVVIEWMRDARGAALISQVAWEEVKE